MREYSVEFWEQAVKPAIEGKRSMPRVAGTCGGSPGDEVSGATS